MSPPSAVFVAAISGPSLVFGRELAPAFGPVFQTRLFLSLSLPFSLEMADCSPSVPSRKNNAA